MNIDILHQDEHLIAVNKPAGLAAIPGRAEETSLLDELGAQVNLPVTGKDDPRLRVVHRLDKDTSGVMVFARTIEAQRFLSHQFQNNTIEKEYVALVMGKPDSDHGLIDAPLGAHPNDPLRRAVVRHGGRPAKTKWVIEQRFRNFTLLRVFPLTGKTHQIRVHLLHIGLPLAIDLLYNPAHNRDGLWLSSFKRDYRANRLGEERPLINRLTLHAHKLSFTHPDGTRMNLEAPLPKDFRATINQLARHGMR